MSVYSPSAWPRPNPPQKNRAEDLVPIGSGWQSADLKLFCLGALILGAVGFALIYATEASWLEARQAITLQIVLALIYLGAGLRRTARLTRRSGVKVAGLEGELRGAQARFGDEEDRFKTIVEAIPLPAWTADAHGRFETFNRYWRTYSGTTGKEFSGGRLVAWELALHPEDETLTLRRWRAAIGEGRAFTLECRFRRAADQQFRAHIVRVTPLRDSSGRLLKWLGTSTELVDRVQEAANSTRISVAKDSLLARQAELLANAAQARDREKLAQKTLQHELIKLEPDTALASVATYEVVEKQARPVLPILESRTAPKKQTEPVVD